MKNHFLRILIILIVISSIFFIIAFHQNNLTQIKSINQSFALVRADLSSTYLKETINLQIDKNTENWYLFGVDQNGYFFYSADENNTIRYYYYEQKSNNIFSFSHEIKDTIMYRHFYYNGEIFLLTKHFQGTDITKINILNSTAETIYKDNGSKIPQCVFMNGKLFFANAYISCLNQIEYRVTSVNLNTNKTSIICQKEMISDNNEILGDSILRIGGMNNILLIEIATYSNEESKELYSIEKRDLNTQQIEYISIENPLDYISGDLDVLITRLYSEGKPIKNNAISIGINSNNDSVYEQHSIFNSDSVRHPFNCKKINDHYIVLTTHDIIIIDAIDQKFDIETYRDQSSQNNALKISQPIIHQNSVYLSTYNNNILAIIKYDFDVK